VDHVTSIGHIPPAPHGRAIEDILRREVSAHPGRWELRVRRLPQSPWWLLRIKRSDGYTRTLLLDPFEQPLHLVAAVLMDALKDAEPPGGHSGH
jgi:hypothetical protein